MAVTIRWVPNTEENVDHYNIYRSDAPTGPFTALGTVDQPTTLPPELQFFDSDGDENHYYKLEAVDTDDVPGLSTDAFQASTRDNRCRVYDRVRDAGGNPLPNVRVEARLSKAAYYNGSVVPQIVSTITNPSGVWYLDLYPNSLLTPDNTEYSFVIQGVNPSARGIVPEETVVKYQDVLIDVF